MFLIIPSLLAAQEEETKTLDVGLDANERNLEKIIVHPFYSQYVSDYDSEYINRVAAKIVAQQEKYFLVISKEVDAQSKLIGIKSLKIEVSKRSSGELRLEAKILDNNTKVIIKRVIRERFPKGDFKAVSEEALKVLFGLKQEYEAGTKIRRRKKKLETIEIPAKPDIASIDLRKRILALKKGLKQEFKIANTKKKKEELDSESKKNKEKNNEKKPLKSGNFVLKNLDDVYEPRDPQKEAGMYTIFTWYALGISSSNFLIKDRAGSDIEILIRTQLNNILANIYSEIWPPYFKQHAYFLRFGMTIPMFNGNEVKPQASPEMDAGFLGAYFNESLYVRLGVRKDRQSFANLPVLGEGIQLAEVDVTWMLASVHYLFLNRKAYVKYQQASQISSDFKGKDFTDGSLEIAKSIIRLGYSSSFILQGSYLEFASQSTAFKATGSRDIVGTDSTMFLMWNLTF